MRARFGAALVVQLPMDVCESAGAEVARLPTPALGTSGVDHPLRFLARHILDDLPGAGNHGRRRVGRLAFGHALERLGRLVLRRTGRGVHLGLVALGWLHGLLLRLAARALGGLFESEANRMPGPLFLPRDFSVGA